MKDQYFGDINDYRKYGLLRGIQSGGECKLLVAWMLTPNDGRRDGGFRSYLQKPKKWKHLDPELFSGLAAVLQSSRTPQVSLIERSSLLPCSTFFSDVVPDARGDRDLWGQALMKSTDGIDLVFLDPDNGIEVPSKPIGRKGSSKYVSWQEIQGLWEARCSILIYQHFRREPREAFAVRMVSELRRRTGAPFTKAFRTAHVLFLLVAQAEHEARFREVISYFLPRWKGQITG
jgi:hypothetical protein